MAKNNTMLINHKMMNKIHQMFTLTIITNKLLIIEIILLNPSVLIILTKFVINTFFQSLIVHY